MYMILHWDMQISICDLEHKCYCQQRNSCNFMLPYIHMTARCFEASTACLELLLLLLLYDDKILKMQGFFLQQHSSPPLPLYSLQRSSIIYLIYQCYTVSVKCCLSVLFENTLCILILSFPARLTPPLHLVVSFSIFYDYLILTFLSFIMQYLLVSITHG